MNDHLTQPDGQPVTVRFNEGLPGTQERPCIFLLDDGSIHAGVIVRNSEPSLPAPSAQPIRPVAFMKNLKSRCAG